MSYSQMRWYEMNYVVYLLGQIGHFLVQAAHLGGDRNDYRANDRSKD